jgi:hypothetical protein
MKLEGKVIGPWVSECKHSWLGFKPTLSGKKLSLDLCGLTFIDDAGLNVLREIYGATNATFIADSPLTKHFVEQIIRGGAKSSEKGN